MLETPIFNAYIDKDHTKGWVRLMLAFGYMDATVSEAELYDSPTSMCMHNDYIEKTIEWALSERLLEPAGKYGRFRLTDKGKQAWRESATSSC